VRFQIESLLLSEVKLPGQYIGGELGSIVKPKGRAQEYCSPSRYFDADML